MPGTRTVRKLWGTSWPHLVAGAAVLAVAMPMVAAEYMGGGGGYSCYSALEDFAGPRPETRTTEFFDAGPPCWDEAKSRVITTAVLASLMFTAWIARCIALSRSRTRGPFVAAFVVVTLIGLYSGLIGGEG